MNSSILFGLLDSCVCKERIPVLRRGANYLLYAKASTGESSEEFSFGPEEHSARAPFSKSRAVKDQYLVFRPTQQTINDYQSAATYSQTQR
jgi:hypothetical protein